MKKIYLLLCICSISLLIILVSCIPAEMETSSMEEPAEAGTTLIIDSETGPIFDDSPINTTFLQGEPSGLWYILSNGISESISERYRGSIVHLTPGASVPNVMRLNNHESDFGLFHSNIAYEALNGISQFEEKHEGVTAIASLSPSSFQFIVSEDLGVKSFEEVVDQQLRIRISAGPKGGSFHEAFIRIIGEYGLTIEDLEDWGCKIVYTGLPETSNMFSNGSIDGYAIIAGAPVPIVMQNAVNRRLVMIEFDQNKIKQVCDKYGYREYQLTANTYNFLMAEIDTFASYTMVGASAKVSNEKAYKMAKSIHLNLDYIRALHAAVNNISAESLVQNITIPLHPGAEMYYREIGLID